jgi:hypothetical protein
MFMFAACNGAGLHLTAGGAHTGMGPHGGCMGM